MCLGVYHWHDIWTYLVGWLWDGGSGSIHSDHGAESDGVRDNEDGMKTIRVMVVKLTSLPTIFHFRLSISFFQRCSDLFEPSRSCWVVQVRSNRRSLFRVTPYAAAYACVADTLTSPHAVNGYVRGKQTVYMGGLATAPEVYVTVGLLWPPLTPSCSQLSLAIMRARHWHFVCWVHPWNVSSRSH